jgi:hypothetical protein
MLIAREEAERQNVLRRLSYIKRRNTPSDKNITYGDLCYVYRDKGDYKGTNAGYIVLYIFIGKEGQTAHVLDESTAKSFPFSMIRPAAAAQMHADEQAKRLRADGIRTKVALRSGTAEYLRRYEANYLIEITGKATSKTTCRATQRKTTCRATQRKTTCRATQRRTMLKTSMIKIILS